MYEVDSQATVDSPQLMYTYNKNFGPSWKFAAYACDHCYKRMLVRVLMHVYGYVHVQVSPTTIYHLVVFQITPTIV